MPTDNASTGLAPYADLGDVTIYQADSREAWRTLPEHCADAIVTSPPYFGLRDYGHDGQLGLEESPQDYIDGLADLLTGYGERVLKPGGSLWLNLGDSYASQPAGAQGGTGITRPKHQAGSRNRTSAKVPDFPLKCLAMIPERVALALIERGWILRNRVVWAKPNGMPSSVTDRLATKHEALFHFVRQPRYHYDLDAIKRPPFRASDVENDAVNPGDWWVVPTQPYPEAHFAVFPPELVRRPILATVPEGGTVLDPFFGSGTTGVMARRLGRRCIGVELSDDYCALAAKRFQQATLDFGGAA